MKVTKKINAVLSAATKAEKKAFTHAADASADYYRLYKLLSKHSDWPEAKLAEAMGYAVRERSFTHAKSYLYRRLTEQLLSSPTADDHRGSLERDYLKARMLYNRGLFSLASEQITRALKHAKRFELYDLQLSLLELEHHVIFMDPDAKRSNQRAKANLAARRAAIDQYELMQRLRQLFNELQELILNTALKQIDTQTRTYFLSHPLLQRVPQKSISSRLIFEMTNLLLYVFFGDDSRALAHLTALETLHAEHPGLIRAQPNREIAIYQSMMRANYWLSRHAQNLALVAELNKLLQNRIFPEAFVIQVRMTVYNIWFISEGEVNDWHVREEFYQELVGFLETYRPQLPAVYFYLSKFNLAIADFYNARYQRAINHLNELIDEGVKHVNAEVLTYSYLMRLLIFIELGSWGLLPYEIQRVQRYLNTYQVGTQYSDCVLQYASAINDRQTTRHDLELLTLADQLNALRDVPEEAAAFKYLDLEHWIRQLVGKE